MSKPSEFDELLMRVSHGDSEAENSLFQKYEPAIRRVVRLRLANLPLKSVVDSVDICQSVMASFFVRLRLGKYRFANANQLIALLMTMAKSKIAAQSRRAQAQCRDRRRLVPDNEVESMLVASTESPSHQCQVRELYTSVMEHFSEDEKLLANLRVDDVEWEEIARIYHSRAVDVNRLQATPESLRKRLTRAMERVAGQFDHPFVNDHVASH